MMRLLSLLVCLGTFGTPSFASANSKAGVLDLETQNGDQIEQAVAEVMTRSIRSLIRGERGWRDVGKLSATLSDAKLAFGCGVNDTLCMKGLAKTLGVNVLLWGTVEQANSNTVLRVWGVSTQGATKLVEQEFNRKSLQGQLKALEERKGRRFVSELRRIAQPLVKALLTRPNQIVNIIARTEPVSALVQINGQDIGRSPITIPLRHGNYTLKLTAEGFASQEVPLQIGPNTRREQSWLLQRIDVVNKKGATPMSTKDIVRWSSLGVATASLAASAVFFNEANKILGPTQDRLCMQLPEKCGAPIGTPPTRLLPRSEFNSSESAHQVHFALYYTSVTFTTLALTTFASTFLLDWE